MTVHQVVEGDPKYDTYTGPMWDLHDAGYRREVIDMDTLILYVLDNETQRVRYLIHVAEGMLEFRVHASDDRMVWYVLPKILTLWEYSQLNALWLAAKKRHLLTVETNRM
jgi:hypothetical protein